MSLELPVENSIGRASMKNAARANSEGTAALEKALDIFETIAAHPNGIGQAELSVLLKVPRTTLYRLLASLVSRGLVRRDPLRRVYCLGFKCFELSRMAHKSGDLVAAASSELRALRDLTGETSYLGVIESNEVLSLERFDGAHSERSSAALGQRKPLHCTSQGKAMLSAMPESRREQIVKELTLKALTPATITDRKRLHVELRISGARGYAFDNEEIVPGIRCVGAPIIDSQGHVRGAISVAGPVWRMSLERLENLGPELAEAARRIGAQLEGLQPVVTQAQTKALPGPWAFEGAFPCYSVASQSVYFADRLAPAVFAVSCNQSDAPTTSVIELARFEFPISSMVLIESDRLLVVSKDRETYHFHLLETTAAGLSEARDAYTPSNLVIRSSEVSAVCSDSKADLSACSRSSSGWVVGQVQANGEVSATWRLTQSLTALAWDENEQILYGADSQSGSLVFMQIGKTAVRRLANVPKGSGKISGITVDGEGGLWVALRDGWSVVRFSMDGNLDKVISLPVPQPTGLCFVPGVIPQAGDEQDLGRLFVCSARHGLALEVMNKSPLSGQLFELTLSSTQ